MIILLVYFGSMDLFDTTHPKYICSIFLEIPYIYGNLMMIIYLITSCFNFNFHFIH